MSPDWSSSPVTVPYAIMENPQSLNLYAYVGGDPIDGQDADGHSVQRAGEENGEQYWTWYRGAPKRQPKCTHCVLEGVLEYGDMGGDSYYGSAVPPDEASTPASAAPEEQQAVPTQAGQQQLPATVSGARDAAVQILAQDNACSTYFNTGATTFIGNASASASNILAGDNVVAVANQTFTTVGATTIQSSGVGATISVNLNSPFSLPVAPNSNATFHIGTAVSSSPIGRVGMIFHELAHTLNMIPRDGGNADQSHANTQTIMQHCEPAIRNYFGLQ